MKLGSTRLPEKQGNQLGTVCRLVDGGVLEVLEGF